MTQLALFAEPVKPGAAPIAAGSHWRLVVKPGGYIRQLRVDFVVGDRVKVVPTNFVDEAWPWTGRTLTAAQLRKDWTMITGRRT